MKKLLYSCLLLLCLPSLMAAPVDRHTAEQVASLYYQALSGQAAGPLTLVDQAETSFLHQQALDQPQPLYYWFNVGEDEGFVLVAGDDRVRAILAYSLSNGHDPEDVPFGLSKWLDDYRREIIYVIENNISATREIQQEWQALRAASFTGPTTRNSVNPLVASKWDQGTFYNDLCPFDNTYNQRTVVGCVATAMAMVMKYWNYPSQGSGFHSYNHQTYGTLSANFGATTYDWNAMPNFPNSPSNALATLMYHCGVSVEMNFGVAQTGGSGAFIVNAASPKQHCSEYALTNYFGYDNSTLQGVLRNGYSTSGWIQLLKGELDAGRPILYGGIGNGGGHAWVCDGYDAQNFFHMNWGWSGNSDGYYSVDALNPSSLGAGGGNGGFNSNQQAVIGIQPPGGGGGGGGGGGTPPPSGTDMALHTPLSVSPNPLDFGGTLSVSFNLINGSSNSPTFLGEIAAALFDENGAFVDFIGSGTESNGLPGGFVYQNNITFSNTIDATPGTYYVGIFVQPTGGNWLAVQSGSYQNIVPLTIQSSNDIVMAGDFVVTPTPVRQGEPFDVGYALTFTNPTPFTGLVSIDLHDLDGTYLETLGEINQTQPLAPGSYNVTFPGNTTNLAPGTYLLATWELTTGGQWELIGSDGTIANPLQVTIAAPLLATDPYENNDAQGNAYPLPLNFSGNQASFKTNGANIHVGSDYDYFRMDLPGGFGYTISARAQDSWSNNDGGTYTNDVLFSYSTNGNQYSDAIDDVMGGPITLNGPATVYFKVSPYFQNETGSYAMDWRITRGASSSVQAPNLDEALNLYPNPAREELFVSLTPEMGQPQQAQILDPTGRVVWQQPEPKYSGGVLSLSGWDLPAGIYLLSLQTDGGQWQQKFKVE